MAKIFMGSIRFLFIFRQLQRFCFRVNFYLIFPWVEGISLHHHSKWKQDEKLIGIIRINNFFQFSPERAMGCGPHVRAGGVAGGKSVDCHSICC